MKKNVFISSWVTSSKECPFGNNFNRRENNDINAALNYGYSIIASEISRVIVSYTWLNKKMNI